VREPVAALVLAGGRSRRLGQDKALLELWPGVPLLARVVRTVSRLCPEVVVVVDAPERYAHLGLPVRWAVDALPGQGPLAALVGGLETVAASHALTVACDLPFLCPPLLAHMLDLPRDYEALVPRWRGRWQPLHAVYARSCLPVARRLLAAGERNLHALLSYLRVRPLPPREIRPYDPLGLSFFDIDTPHRLRRARELAARTEP